LSEPVVLRGVRAFCFERPRPALLGLASDFDREWARFTDRLHEHCFLLETIWESDDPDLVRALLPRVEWLTADVADAYSAMARAVDLGEATRFASLFVSDEPPLSALRTQYAMNQGVRDVRALEMPLTDADRARIACDRRRRS